MVSGKAWLNEAILSGEANLTTAQKNTKVYAGTKVERGNIVVQAIKKAEASRFSMLLNESQHKALYKISHIRLEEHFAYYFSPYLLFFKFMLSHLFS